MFGRRKVDKELNQELLLNIKKTKKEWEDLNNIIEQSIEPSEEGLAELAVIKAKYFYLLREARVRGVNALS
ncbi:YaaL family protein [Halobacillus yeomjeoni]|uniref:YaaL family protein n=1 Tax=Halobacillus yeomjeoni TaxID=311194 RepID=A0A931HVG1_9BACI|nr:YaaL family protein [Halobacillus yeomjeoni]MBH0230209.1 YaaL family protein [Halobacillus yeomjeoni]MCA0984937.1 YaaL family protein [Halobacillus yeomjeoni]